MDCQKFYERRCNMAVYNMYFTSLILIKSKWGENERTNHTTCRTATETTLFDS